MAKGINKVILIGNLGADPEVRYAASGNAVATISVATTDSWKNRETGERETRTEWHRVVFFTRLAEIVGEYLRKGSKVYVEGALRTRKWQDKEGNDRYTTEVVGNDMAMLDSRGSGAGDAGEAGFGAAVGGNQDFAASAATAASGKKPETATASAGADFDDDVPF